MDSLWAQFLKYLSQKEIGDIFSRKELQLSLGGFTKGGTDSYRLLASKKNFLKSAGRGKYQVTRKFPTYINLAEFISIPRDNLGYLEYIYNRKVNNHSKCVKL